MILGSYKTRPGSLAIIAQSFPSEIPFCLGYINDECHRHRLVSLSPSNVPMSDRLEVLI